MIIIYFPQQSLSVLCNFMGYKCYNIITLFCRPIAYYDYTFLHYVHHRRRRVARANAVNVLTYCIGTYIYYHYSSPPPANYLYCTNTRWKQKYYVVNRRIINYYYSRIVTVSIWYTIVYNKIISCTLFINIQCNRHSVVKQLPNGK